MIWIVIGLAVLLVLVASVEPYNGSLSEFELKRRIDKEDMGALLDSRRSNTWSYLLTWQKLTMAWLLVIISALLVTVDDWLGILWALLIALLYSRLSTIAFIRRFTKGRYDKLEPKILLFAERTKKFIRPFRGWVASNNRELQVGSKDELRYIIANSGIVLSNDQRQRMLGSIDFKNKLVKKFMVPKSDMHTVSSKELLGPLVLDHLYKTGHSYFPVTKNDTDDIVGLLHIQDLFTLKSRQSPPVQEVMNSQVFYIRDDQSLDRAFALCLKRHRPMLMVVDKSSQVVGLITMTDIVRELIGHELVDQFDDYDNLRKVAKK